MNARSQSTHWEVTSSPPPGADACYSLPLPSLEMFPPFHAIHRGSRRISKREASVCRMVGGK
jgi:hypothetical protein